MAHTPHTYSTGDTITAALLNQAEADLAAAIPKADADAAYDAKGAATAAQAAAVQRANHTGTQSADSLVDGTTNKAYTAAEKTKLAGVATGATANATDAALRDRSTHTGTQAASTVTGLSTVATTGAYTDLTAKPTIPTQYTDAQAVAANASALAGKAPQLVPTATKTAAYTAAVGDLAVMNVAGGATVLTLPTAPADKSTVGFLAIGATTATPLTVTPGGTDTVGSSGATSVTVPLSGEVTTYQYQAASTRWLPVANVKPLTALDARYVQPSGLGLTVVKPSGDTTGVADAAAINAALNTARLAGGGAVKLVAGQTYYFNDRLVVGSYVTLDATGAWVRQVDNTNKRQTTNYSWLNPVGTASDASITAAASVITSATLAPLAAVGQSITVAGAAGPSGAPVTFCGFVSAVNTGTSQITVTNLDGTTLTALNTVTNAAAVLYNRDIKPRVIGGFWDRGANNHLGFASDQSIHAFHHCDYPYVHPEGVYSQMGSDSGHCIDFADVTRCFGQLDHVNHQGVGVQLTGPVYGATIPRIVGTLFDDAFAITASDWATNQIETSGNVVGVWVGHIDVTSNMRLVNIIAGLGNLVDEIVVDTVHGTGSNSIGVVNIGDDVQSTSTVGGTYGSIEIRKIAARPKAGSRCVNLISPSFKKIKLGLDYTPWTYSALKTFVEMTGASAVFPQQLEITGYAELAAGQTTVNVFSENSTSVQLDHLVVHDFVYDCNSSTGSLVALQTSNRVNNVDIHRVRMNSGSATFASTLVSLGTSANLGNLRILGGLAWQVQKIISDTSTVTSNITIGGGFLAQAPAYVYWGSPASAATTKTITHAGAVYNSVGTAAFFTTNVPLTFYGDLMVTTGAFTMLSRGSTEVVNAYGNALPFDLAMLARTVGEFCTDASNRTTSGVMPVVCTTTAALGWKNMAGGTY